MLVSLLLSDIYNISDESISNIVSNKTINLYLATSFSVSISTCISPPEERLMRPDIPISAANSAIWQCLAESSLALNSSLTSEENDINYLHFYINVYLSLTLGILFYVPVFHLTAIRCLGKPLCNSIGKCN